MSVLGIGSAGQNYAQLSPMKAANQLTSGKKINSAADDVAGMAIATSLETQSKGANVAVNNAKDMGNLLNLAGGAMGQISEGLGRIRELGVQASNGIYSDSDKGIFQEEINGILENINSIGKNTQFNGKSVLDGSFTSQAAVVSPNGESTSVSIGSTLTDALGISGFDVTGGSVDLGAVDTAMEAVSDQMATAGAMSNRLDASSKVMENEAYNMEVARSRVEDSDIAKASLDNSRQKATEQVGISMQKMKMEGMGNFLRLIG